MNTPLQDALNPGIQPNISVSGSSDGVSIVIVLDQSGSMSSVTDATRSTLKQYLDAQPTQTPVTLVRFNHHVEVFPARSAASLAGNLGFYQPNGGTALHDAIGQAITFQLGKPTSSERVMLAIITDGEENSSKEWNRAEVQALLKLVDRLGWGVAYLGAGLDAFRAGQNLGIRAEAVRGYSTTRGLSSDMGTALLSATANYRTTGLTSYSVENPDPLTTASGFPYTGHAATDDTLNALPDLKDRLGQTKTLLRHEEGAK